ncbi:hypothetical protein FGG08_005599 [Glutinoglossum americanum]|uniref:Uncharacterized protein n=1 Tax=Glutinoglossum americanum TaxID=1670608 RepID=A0A9P8I2M9_9PEZI|nr:hypothetical protein FGG08_005599 [Glutinoglossum americanum]
MICDVKAQFIDDSRNLDEVDLEITAAQPANGFYNLQLVFRRHCFLQSSSGKDIAIAHSKTSNALRTLNDLDSIRYEVLVAPDEWKKKTLSFKKIGKAACMTVEINVFGAVSKSQAVGKVLSKAGIYLQHPRLHDIYVKYENPHFISFPHLSPPTSGLTIPSLAPDVENSVPFANISSILDGLDQRGHLQRADIDPRITTILLSHQREGVDFIVQKEEQGIHAAFSLWETHQDSTHGIFHQHTITGCRKPVRPDESVGGIIADDMGLGKSLTLLSAMVASLGSARAFVELGDCNQKPRSGSTLIIVPAVLLRRHVASDSLKVIKYHGRGRETDLSRILDSDVVLTTYATATAEFCRGTSTLHKFNWYRVVLDEGSHSIRHQHTKQFRAIDALSARYRWCLTGTPIQNRLEDLEALVRFLRVPFLDKSSFRGHITHPIESGRISGLSNLRLLLRCICLRRTGELLELPEPQSFQYLLELSSAEQDEYATIGEAHRQAIDDAVSGHTTAETYQGILQALLRLRLLCNHGLLAQRPQVTVTGVSEDPDVALSLLQQSDQATCAYCSCDITSIGDADDTRSGAFIECSHLLCLGCMLQTTERSKVWCPLCQASVSGSGSSPRSGDKHQDIPIPQHEEQCTKLAALVRDVEEHRFTDKSIVFSCWKQTIRTIASLFTIVGIPFGLVDGSMSLPERRIVLDRFQRDPEVPLLLMTLGTGAVGLNLTAASRIHIVEPQWNPSVESQAIGRALRLGQEKQVTVVRYIMINTVEQYIQSRQSRKLQLAQIGWNVDSDDLEKQKLKELLVK